MSLGPAGASSLRNASQHAWSSAGSAASQALDLLAHFNGKIELPQRVPDAREVQTVLVAGPDQLLFRIITLAVTFRQLSRSDEDVLQLRGQVKSALVEDAPEVAAAAACQIALSPQAAIDVLIPIPVETLVIGIDVLGQPFLAPLTAGRADARAADEGNIEGFAAAAVEIDGAFHAGEEPRRIDPDAEPGAKHACRVDGLVVKISDPIQRPVHDVRMYHDIRYCHVRTAHSLDDINEVDDILDVVPMRDHVEPHARAIFGGQRGNEFRDVTKVQLPPFFRIDAALGQVRKHVAHMGLPVARVQRHGQPIEMAREPRRLFRRQRGAVRGDAN